MTVQKTTMKRILLRHGGIGVGNPVYGNSQRQTRDVRWNRIAHENTEVFIFKMTL